MLEKYMLDQMVSEYKGHMFAFFWLFINNSSNNNNNIVVLLPYIWRVCCTQNAFTDLISFHP